jgi:Lon protease-like protein
MYNETMETLALFPLNTVLFPGQLLPLHIFEPRYKQMIGECIQHGRPFGVVLIRSGDEVGAAAEPYQVGTTAHIVQVEHTTDERMNILCVGNARFRIAETFHDKPYLTGKIELWPWEPFAAGSADVERVQRQLDRYVQILAEMTDSQLEVELPSEPAALANVAASVLQIDSAEKQRLLATFSIGQLLNDVSAVFQRELRAWRIVQASRELSLDETTPFSLN